MSIREGFKNYMKKISGNPDPEAEKLYEERISICIKDECGFYSILSFCHNCTCDLEAKARDKEEHCPVKLW